MFLLPRLFFRLPRAPRESGKPHLLLITNAKRNQGYYRDSELVRQTNGVRITEEFPYDRYGWDIRRVLDAIYGTDWPDIIYVHYSRHYTHRIQHLDKVPVLKIGFVGDPQDFLDQEEKHVVKRRWLVEAGVEAYMTIAPEANWMVWKGLGDESIPIVNSHLAMDPAVFHDLRLRRTRDIGSFGAHTDKKYPFRIQVREFLLSQDEYTYNKRQRVGHGGNDAAAFARELNRYISCFTCASVYGYTVAKYFEIPACGTLLFGEKTSLLGEFGFRDGVNFVEVSPKDFKDKFHYYLREIHSDDRARIAQAGQELVISRHTWRHRAEGIVQGFRELLAARSGAPPPPPGIERPHASQG
jgi:hypothetical protein